MNIGMPGLTSAAIIAALGFTPASAGAVVMADGSAASPGMFFGSTTDLGFYLAAADTLGFAIGGVAAGSMATDNFWWKGHISTGPTSYKSTVDMEIRDVNADGYIEARLAKDTQNFTAWYFHPDNIGLIEVWTWTGASSFDISPKPWDAVSNAEVSVFRNTPVGTGLRAFRIYSGDLTLHLWRPFTLRMIGAPQPRRICASRTPRAARR
jgi:hypothetical protein